MGRKRISPVQNAWNHSSVCVFVSFHFSLFCINMCSSLNNIFLIWVQTSSLKLLKLFFIAETLQLKSEVGRSPFLREKYIYIYIYDIPRCRNLFCKQNRVVYFCCFFLCVHKSNLRSPKLLSDVFSIGVLVTVCLGNYINIRRVAETQMVSVRKRNIQGRYNSVRHLQPGVPPLRVVSIVTSSVPISLENTQPTITILRLIHLKTRYLRQAESHQSCTGIIITTRRP